jgi:hypothetical protein
MEDHSGVDGMGQKSNQNRSGTYRSGKNRHGIESVLAATAVEVWKTRKNHEGFPKNPPNHPAIPERNKNDTAYTRSYNLETLNWK